MLTYPVGERSNKRLCWLIQWVRSLINAYADVSSGARGLINTYADDAGYMYIMNAYAGVSGWARGLINAYADVSCGARSLITPMPTH